MSSGRNICFKIPIDWNAAEQLGRDPEQLGRDPEQLGIDPKKSLIIGFYLPILRDAPVFNRIHIGYVLGKGAHLQSSQSRNAHRPL
jgi:hypothetical protein